MEHANTTDQRELVKFLKFNELNQTIVPNSKLLSTSLQFQSMFQSILIQILVLSKCIKVELLVLDVEIELTDQSLPSDMELRTEKNTSSFKPQMDIDGEITDTSKLKQKMRAVFSQILYS